MTAVLPAVRAGYRAGLCLLPVCADGSKAPDVSSWAQFKTTRPTLEQMRAWDFATRHGVGIIAGPVSQHVETWDFDDRATFDAFIETAAAIGFAAVVQRIRDGYEDQTPGGGVRWLVRYPVSVMWRDVTLARRPGRAGEPPIKTLIELPTFAIVAPSNGQTHPSGRPYVRVSGDFASIASYAVEERDALLTLARTFDAMPRREATRSASRPASPDSTRPGDDYNRRMTWPALLEPYGWRHVCDRGETAFWRRPGKDHGVSATTNHAGSDLFFPFTSSTAFEPDTSYTKFGCYALLEHGGDYARAAKQLAAEGFGQPVASTASGPTAHGSAPDAKGPLSPLVTCLRDVEPEDVSWFWRGRVGRKKVQLLVGDPGLGKSWITLDVTARVSTGQSWPDAVQDPSPAASVLLLSAEDGLADTIRPRLDRLGADVSRVYHLAVLKSGEHERAIQLADIGALAAAIAQVRAELLVIDPVSAYLGHTDSHRDAEVRGLLAPLARLAEITGAAVLGVMHLAKSAQKPAIYRAVGSIAFAAAARVVLAVAKDPHSERRILASVKNNLGPDAAALSYTLADGRLVWDTAPMDAVDIDALLAGPSFDRAEHREADLWLTAQLADGPMLSKDLEQDALEAGFSRRTLFRAKTRLKVEVERIGFGSHGKWYWSLPPKSATSKECHVAPFEETPVNTASPSKSATENDVAPFDETAPARVLGDDGRCPPAEVPFADRDEPTVLDPERWRGRVPGPDDPPNGISPEAWARHHRGDKS